MGRFNSHLLNEIKLPFVEIIFLRGGYSENQIKILGKNDSKGIVVAGFGAGTIPNNLAKIISEMDDLKAMMREVTLDNFEENFEEDE